MKFNFVKSIESFPICMHKKLKQSMLIFWKQQKHQRQKAFKGIAMWYIRFNKYVFNFLLKIHFKNIMIFIPPLITLQK
jgi:hypothetical protein